MSASTQRSGAVVGQRGRALERHDRSGGQGRFAEHEDMAGDACARAGQQLLGDGSGGDAGGGLACARAFEDVAHVGAAVLGHARRGRRAPGADG